MKRRGIGALARVAGVGLVAVVGLRAPVLAETLTAPSVLQNVSSTPNTVEVDLVAQPSRLALVPGTETNVWAYNGQVPGPTLEVREGDRVIVHFQNKLPEATTIHWHGLHIPVAADGNPMDPVQPGGTYDYEFTIQPGTAGTYWYHPHPHRKTLKQVANGLFGALIVRAPDDPLPAAITEKLLILWDNRFKADGSINLPGSLSDFDLVTGREGTTLFVNQQTQPTIPIRSGEIQRWRVINAAAGRYYRLALPGHTLMHVGSDAGLFERPVEASSVLLAPSERVELLVRGTGAPGSQVKLQSLPYDRYHPDFRPKDSKNTLELLTLQYTADEPTAPLAIPDTLRPVPALDPSKAAATQKISMANGQINGKSFSMTRVDVRAKLNTTEVWTILNPNPIDHSFHLHGFSFQVLDSKGVPIPAWEDTVNIKKNGRIQIIVEFKDYPGKRMLHCHTLAHEDVGLMGILEVQE
jgi:FtsP/CotA-like multicopper oxidase with cupredoxin domain